MMTARSLILALLFISTLLYAHEDKILTLSDGQITGLPKRYEPASLDIGSGTLRIGTREIILSPSLRALFPEDGSYDLRITASWYHEPEIIPYYIALHITPKGRDFSYVILLNLDSLEPIRVQVELRESEVRSRTLNLVFEKDSKIRNLSN